MKHIFENDILELLNSNNDLIEGKKDFRTSKFQTPSITENKNNINIDVLVDNTNVALNIENDSLNSFKCHCDVHKFNNKICKHIVCAIQIYNEYINHHTLDYDSFTDVVVSPVISKNEKDAWALKVFISFASKDINMVKATNIKRFFENDEIYYLFLDKGIKKSNINEEGLKLLEELKQICVQTNSLSSENYISINYENIDVFMDFFCKNNLFFTQEPGDTYLVTEFHYGYEKYDLDLSGKPKPTVNIKKRYSLKGIKEHTFFQFSSKQKTYLFINVQSKNELKIFEFDISKEKHVADFIEYINKPVPKAHFYSLYLALKSLFWNSDNFISGVYITREKIDKIDPMLEIKIFKHEELASIVAKLTFVYGPESYPYNPDEKDYIRRERFLEQKILSDAEQYLLHYNLDYGVFEFVETNEWNNFLEWSEKKSSDVYYSIKIDENILFKPKKRKKFQIQAGVFDNDFLKTEWTIEGFNSEDARTILNAYVKKAKFVKISSGKKINLATEIDLDELSNEIQMFNLDINEMCENDKVNVPVNNWKFFANQHADKIDQWLKDKINDFYDYKNVKLELPEKIEKSLKDYQKDGCKWFTKLVSMEAGGILADDMGLGKTFQTIAFLSQIYFNKKTKLPSIVICPSSLIYNWSKEFDFWAPFLKYIVVDGRTSVREQIIKKSNEYNILITSYSTYLKDSNTYADQQYYLQIIDEAQKIKNDNASTTQKIKEINSKHRFALTGTPIENNLIELWSIFDFLMPGFLYDKKTFKHLYEDKIIGNDKSATEALRKRIEPYVLRRKKDEVLTLPEKSLKIITNKLNDEQKQLYMTAVYEGTNEIDNLMKAKNQKVNTKIFATLNKLRQICCSPKIVFENAHSNGEKLDNCLRLVSDILNNGDDNKILIFSNYVKMIDVLEQEFKNRKIPCLKLTGNVKAKERIELVENFNQKKHYKIFLISLKAGGTGLTLTSANNVIHYDPWWNGSLEDQATDRAYRIGQSRSVNIYKLITEDSIEEKVLKLQETKKEIFKKMFEAENAIESGNISNLNVSIDEMRELLGIKLESET